MLSRSECEILFNQNIINSETLENTDDLKGLSDRPLENTTNISNRGMKFINESGLYTLIARSNKPEAKLLKILTILGVTIRYPRNNSININSII